MQWPIIQKSTGLTLNFKGFICLLENSVHSSVSTLFGAIFFSGKDKKQEISCQCDTSIVKLLKSYWPARALTKREQTGTNVFFGRCKPMRQIRRNKNDRLSHDLHTSSDLPVSILEISLQLCGFLTLYYSFCRIFIWFDSKRGFAAMRFCARWNSPNVLFETVRIAIVTPRCGVCVNSWNCFRCFFFWENERNFCVEAATFFAHQRRWQLANADDDFSVTFA